VETALWSTTDDNDRPLDDTKTAADIDPATLDQMVADCAEFRAANKEILARYTDEDAGHDFWLTRNRHGAGFWDGDYAEADGEALTTAAHAFGEVWPYVGDDGRIYISK